MAMTEDDNGRVRASDEEALLKLDVEEFFMKLLVFQERMEKKIEQLKSKK